MSPAMSELLQTAAVAAIAFGVLTLIALLLKAEANGQKHPAAPPKP